MDKPIEWSNIAKINDIEIKTIDDVESAITTAKMKTAHEKLSKRIVQMQFVMLEKVAIHSQKGIPQMQIRQLSDETVPANIAKQKDAKVVEKLTRRILIQRDDCVDWWKSEAKQLEQYQQQGMFGEPEPRPVKANILSLLWTYLMKSDGTKRQVAVAIMATLDGRGP